MLLRDGDRKMTKKKIKEYACNFDWPFTVSEVVLKKVDNQIFVISKGIKYKLNGSCRSGVELDPIWKDSNVSYAPKIDLSPIFSLCRSWGWF